MIPHFVKFRSDNFTDHKRTPWGGTSIARHIKANLDLNFPPTIGESWEFSATKELPSICDAADNRTFAELLADKNNACYWLSSAHRQAWGQKTPLLVKYIDAKRNLSVQIHPDIDDRSLPVACCGKWEAWLVLRCEPNAGVYLGIKPGTTRQQLYDAANNAHRFEDILQFCPVKCGDLISVPPRIVHALGAGLCVLEPQVLTPGKCPISLRIYDWHHRYDDSGDLSPHGLPRQLHVDEALALIDTDPRANRPIIYNVFDNTPGAVNPKAPVSVRRHNPIPSLTMIEIIGSGDIHLDDIGELAAVVVTHGAIDLHTNSEDYSINQGESGALAANSKNICIKCKNTWAQIIYCSPRSHGDIDHGSPNRPPLGDRPCP